MNTAALQPLKKGMPSVQSIIVTVRWGNMPEIKMVIEKKNFYTGRITICLHLWKILSEFLRVWNVHISYTIHGK